MNHYRRSVQRTNRRLAVVACFLTVLSIGLAFVIRTWATTFTAGFTVGICMVITHHWWQVRRVQSEETGVFVWTCPECEGRNFSEGPKPTPGETVSCSECEFEAVVGRAEEK